LADFGDLRYSDFGMRTDYMLSQVTRHHHESNVNHDTILLSVDDWPGMKKAGFYMKEEQAP